MALANLKALGFTNQGRDKILDGDCVTVQAEFDLIVGQMTVPLVQGMLKYAFKSDPANSQGSCTDGDCPKEWGELWAFAAAILPMIHNCDADVASTIYTATSVDASAPMSNVGFAELKASVETVYSCMGITCAGVGEFQNSAGIYTGMGACEDGATTVTTGGSSKKSETVNAMPLIIVAVVALILLLVSLVLFFQWRKTETKLYELVANGDKNGNNML